MTVYLLPDDQSSLIVQFDLTVSEAHEATAAVTEHPVETGSNIADHVRTDPETLTLEVYVSNSPNNNASGRGQIGPVDLPNTDRRIDVLHFSEPIDRVKEMHELLKDLWRRRQSSSVLTRTSTYEKMVLVRVSAPFTEAGGASFFLDLKQIKTATSATVRAPKPAEKRGAPAKAKGGQATKPDKDGAKSTSLALKALSALGVNVDDI